ncbi:hypothetical protein ACI3KS_00070 [Microbacterium sp. ZW T5_45]|uniref:hypothetical protein n=1 Tax=Microbacterium sp. ZW T5_45 TaxID=3378080 RepID=UPI0038530D7B
MSDDEQLPAEIRRLGLEPDDLDGHTLEDLSDYLDAGRTPADASIDGSPGCQLALDALERLRRLGGELLEADAAAHPAVDESWVDRILGGIALDVRAGRRIPYAGDDVTVDSGITEGAVRGVIRSAENAVPGILVGRSTLVGDVETIGAPVRIGLEISALYGTPIPRAVESLRREVADRLHRQTDLVIDAIDITVRDVQRFETWTEGGA